MTDEENQEDNNDFDSQSLALRSCYGSITELNSSNNERVVQIKSNRSFIESNLTETEAKSQEIQKVGNKIKIDVDANGWRLV